MPKRTNEAKWVESRQRWQINVTNDDGERKTFTSSTEGRKGKVEAEHKADAWLKESVAKDVRFEKLWEDFIKEIKETTSTANYVKHESIGRLWILPEVKHKKISAITNQDWQDCINAAYKKGLSKKTCKNVRATITTVYNYASKKRSPMRRPENISIPRDAPVKKKNILQPDQLKTLLTDDKITLYRKQVPSFFIHAWRFIVLTGMRRGELCGLKDISNNVIQIERSINTHKEETPGKNERAVRLVVLSKRAVDVLNQQREMLKKLDIESDWLFPDEAGDRLDPNHLYKCWYTYRNQHGFKSSLHELRHTLVSVAETIVPGQMLKKQIGHGPDMDTFGIYGHEIDGDKELFAELIDKAFDRVLE